MNIRESLSNFFYLLGFLLKKEKQYSLKDLSKSLHDKVGITASAINELELLEEHKTYIWEVLEKNGTLKSSIILEECIAGTCQDIAKDMMYKFLTDIRNIHKNTNSLSSEEWFQFQNISQGYFNDLLELVELKVIHLINDVIIEYKLLQDNNEIELSKYGIISHTIEE